VWEGWGEGTSAGAKDGFAGRDCGMEAGEGFGAVCGTWHCGCCSGRDDLGEMSV